MSESVSTSDSEMFFQEIRIAETAGAGVAAEAGFWEWNLISNGACQFFERSLRGMNKEGNKAYVLILDLRPFME